MARWYSIVWWCCAALLLISVGIMANDWPGWTRLLVFGFAVYFLHCAYRAYRAQTFVLSDMFGREIRRETRKKR
jgi:hypothetical protein